MDAAFIDRDNPKAAVESLKKVEELARKGLSILIAPEGTRLDTTEVGPFKKGPFRIAMSAGIPIVPIVIRNAEVISARDSTTFNPGTVDVVVYPPIPVDDWTVQNLADRIAEVRQLYLDTLKDWPHEKVPKIGPYARAEEHRQEGAGEEGAEEAREEGRQEDGCQEGGGQEDDRQEDNGQEDGGQEGDGQEGTVVTAADPMASFSTTDDALVLASVSSPAERELLSDWLQQQRREHPDSNVDGARASRRGPAAGRAGPARRGTRSRRGPHAWSRCGSSGCPAACPPARRWSR